MKTIDKSRKLLAVGLAVQLVLFNMAFSYSAAAAPGDTRSTVVLPPELPIEVETELSPAGSLKQAPLWHELAQLLEDPFAVDCPADDPGTPGDEGKGCIALIERRQSFGTVMPPLNVWSPCANVLIGQPLRLRTSDGEISWDQPGLLFGPDDGDPTTPITEVLGDLIVDVDNNNLIVSNPDGNPGIPPDGTVVAIPACNSAGQIVEIVGGFGTNDPVTAPVAEFEMPISELDLLRSALDVADVPPGLVSAVGRPAAQALGKALFWDMQVGSDGVQACASCHFHAGVDNRTRNQINPNHLGGDLTFQIKQPNEEILPGDFPFHKLVDPAIVGEPLLNPGNVASDANDVMSSMGVAFREFVDIPEPGAGAFGPAVAGVSPLLPDIGNAVADPIPGFQGLRRVEPRNTPTIFSAAFNFDNFWDGRARHDFNGGSVFGPTDPQFHIFINDGTETGPLAGASNGHFRPDLIAEDPEIAEQPVRIRFSSLASLATGPALSNFEMSFDGRNWQKIGKKLLQAGVTPLANQLVAVTDSVLGPYSNQGGSDCPAGVTAPGKPGLCIGYPDLIKLAFRRDLWANTAQHMDGSAAPCDSAVNGELTPLGCDPFDGYVLSAPVDGSADPINTNQFTQMEANFSLFFGQSLQMWQQILIPDDTPFDRFLDANPRASYAVGQPGEQGTLPPDAIPGLVGPLTFPDPDLFGPDELFGFDIFAGSNLTAALPVGSPRNPTGVGSNPFMRTARCMLCHFGPEQSDHTNNINAGLMLSDTEVEFPTPPASPEPTGPFRVVTGLSLAEEVEENAQDGVELELRNFAVVDNPATPYDDRVVGTPSAFSFQDNGIYNIGVRPTPEDIMRGGTDAFGWPLALASLALKNVAGPDFEPCDAPGDTCTGAMPNFDPALGAGGGLFEPTGADQLINPGLAMEPTLPLLPEYLAPWANNLSAGENHPQVDELAVAPNTITEPIGGPMIEFGEVLFGSDANCGTYDPDQFGAGPPNFGWGPLCPNSQSAVPNNFETPLNGTWPFANRVARNGAVKVPQLRNVELTGPYFHTGSYLTLRQVVDFYMRGGDFPVTNGEDRDPNLVNVGEQAFGFGATNNEANLPPDLLDSIPDVLTRYGPMPDTTSATPEYATPEDAKVSLVKFLLSLTDQRVKFERAPFDHPEVIIPVDGTATENTGGRNALLADPLFKQIPAVGAAGNATPLAGFLMVSNTPGLGPDHFDRSLSPPDIPPVEPPIDGSTPPPVEPPPPAGVSLIDNPAPVPGSSDTPVGGTDTTDTPTDDPGQGGGVGSQGGGTGGGGGGGCGLIPRWQKRQGG